MNVAWFITPHGFGHTTRSVAIMAAMQRIRPVRFEIFSSVPEFLFDGIKDLRFHDHVCDVGLVQKSSIEVDLPATVTALDRFLADHESAVIQLATTLQDLAVSLVVCDISPIGIAAAKRAGLPVVLVENFTWDWIYEGYLDQEPRLTRYIDYFHDLYGTVDVHLQTAPICFARPQATATGVVSRENRDAQLRDRLCPEGRRLVIITMGGIAQNMPFLDLLKQRDDILFLLPGLNKPGSDNLLARPDLPDPFYHPDLILAADAVIGKLGYSTVAEIYQSGVPFGFVERPDFRESAVLADFIRRHNKTVSFNEKTFISGRWLDRLDDLLAPAARTAAGRADGAQQAARICLDLGTTAQS